MEVDSPFSGAAASLCAVGTMGTSSGVGGVGLGIGVGVELGATVGVGVAVGVALVVGIEVTGGGIFKKCVNSQAVYPLSEQHGLEAQERR